MKKLFIVSLVVMMSLQTQFANAMEVAPIYRVVNVTVQDTVQDNRKISTTSPISTLEPILGYLGTIWEQFCAWLFARSIIGQLY